MFQMQRVLFAAVPFLLFCCSRAATDVDMTERVLSMTTEGGKGKGKGSSSGNSDDYMMSMMSMDISMSGKGKGKGSSSKLSKSTKAPKSSKSSKSDKKGSKSSKKGGPGDGETRAPHPGGTGEPTGPPGPPSPPSAPSPITPSPTSANSIPIRATPFALFYDGDFTRIPNDSEFAEVAEVTRVFLEELLIQEFEATSLTNLDDFLTFMIRNSFDFGEPVQADYRCTGLFNPSSIFLPTVRELNELITAAFEDDSLDTYISRIQGLPSGNIFRTTTGIMKGLPNVPVPRGTTSGGSTSGSGTFKMGLAAAAAGIVVLAAGAAMLKRKRGEENLEDPYNDNLKGDSQTLAGETCTASLDSSSAWRKDSPYATDADRDDEFEDEPLDSDDEHETTKATRPSRQRGFPPKAAFTT